MVGGEQMSGGRTTATGRMTRRDPSLRGGDLTDEMTSLARRGEAAARRSDALSPRAHVMALSHAHVFSVGDSRATIVWI